MGNLSKVLSFAAILLIVGCGKTEEKTIVLSEANPILGGKKSVDEKGYNMVLKLDAFDQLYLMTVAEIDGAPAPAGSAKANKIVFFEKKDNSVYMFESLNGKLASNSVPTKALLTEFPIISQNNEEIEIDFKKGMTVIFEKGSYFVSDSGQPDAGDSVFEITSSYIDKIEVRGKHIFIDQFARAQNLTARGTVKNKTAHLKYTFSTYVKNEDFKPVASNKQKKVGYFEVHPTLEAGTGTETVNIMKFDTKEPIVYSLSRNIPEQYLTAVKEGVLYWNKTFGKEVIKVNTLPEGINVHEPGYNIVQWLKWDTAGFAYANMMGDPLTGETLQSHVYMTSVFGIGGYKRAKRTYKKLLANKSSTSKNKSAIKIKGFESAKTCEFHHRDSLVTDLGEMINTVDTIAEEKGLDEEKKDAIFKRFSEDYVRQVVAHEVGHTLGLRHNFAGSLATNISKKLFPKVSKIYFLTGNLLPGMIPAGTVMDYTPGMLAAMMGASIRLDRKALTYDQQAIDFGYSGKEQDLKTFDVFCTDTHRGPGTYHDCKIWDKLANPFDAAKSDSEEGLSTQAFTLASMFSFLNDKEVTNKIEKINKLRLFPKKDAVSLYSKWLSALPKMLETKAEFISLRRNFPEEMNVIEEEEYKAKTAEYKAKNANRRDGLAALLFDNLKGEGTTNAIETVKKTFTKNMKNLYKDMTEEESKAAEAKLATYFPVFERELLILFGKNLSGAKFSTKDENFVTDLFGVIDNIANTNSTEELGSSAANSYVVMKKVYDYKDLRKTFVNLASKNFFPESPSYKRNLKAAKATLKKAHKAEMAGLLEATTEEELEDELFDYLTNEKSVFSGL